MVDESLVGICHVPRTVLDVWGLSVNKTDTTSALLTINKLKEMTLNVLLME